MHFCIHAFMHCFHSRITTMKIIEIKNLHKVYTDNSVSVNAVNGVDLTFDEGEFTAIVGPSGSGKTTVAYELAEQAGNCCLISQDNYYQSLPDGVDAKDWNFDDPAVIDLEHLACDLERLKRSEIVKGPHYIFSAHTRAPDTVTLKPAPVIIVEGLFLFLPKHLRNVFDLKIFIDVPLEVCLERRIARDVVERGRTETMIRQRWVEQVNPMYRKYVEPTRAFADLMLAPEERSTPERTKQISKLLKYKEIL